MLLQTTLKALVFIARRIGLRIVWLRLITLMPVQMALQLLSQIRRSFLIGLTPPKFQAVLRRLNHLLMPRLNLAGFIEIDDIIIGHGRLSWVEGIA